MFTTTGKLSEYEIAAGVCKEAQSVSASCRLSPNKATLKKIEVNACDEAT